MDHLEHEKHKHTQTVANITPRSECNEDPDTDYKTIAWRVASRTRSHESYNYILLFHILLLLACWSHGSNYMSRKKIMCILYIQISLSKLLNILRLIVCLIQYSPAQLYSKVIKNVPTIKYLTLSGILNKVSEYMRKCVRTIFNGGHLYSWYSHWVLTAYNLVCSLVNFLLNIKSFM